MKQPIILRAYALYALAKALGTAKRAVTDSVAKDIIKHSKNALSDKALAVQRAACEVGTPSSVPGSHYS